MSQIMRHKVVVYSSSLNLSEAGEDPTEDIIVSAILSNSDIPGRFVEAMFQGIGAKMRAIYNYAKTSYYLGLPSGYTGVRNAVDDALIGSIIEIDVPHPTGVVVDYAFSAPMTPEYAVLPTLITERDYNVLTKQIHTYPPDMPVPPPYCVDWNEQNDCIEWDQQEIVVYADEFTDTGSITAVSITYGIYAADTGEFLYSYQETFPYYYVGVTWNNPYIFAHYRVKDALGNPLPEVHFWLYDGASDKYPELSGEVRELEYDTFLPVVPVRYKNKDLTDDRRKDTQQYITSKKLLDKISMDFDLLGERINENPDIDSIDHAYVIFGINLQSDLPESMWYLGNFISSLYDTMTSTEEDFFNSLEDPRTSIMPANGYETANKGGNLEEYGLDLSFYYDYITIGYSNGVIGKVGYAKKHISYRELDNEYAFGLLTRKQPILRIDMQVTSTEIKHVTIFGFVSKNLIYHSHAVITDPLDVKYDDSNNFVIPVLFRLGQDMPLKSRNRLYTDATIMIINCYDKIKVKWYQSSWFKIIVMVAIIVVVAWSGQAWVANLAAAFETGVSVLLMELAMTAILSIALKYAVNWVVEEIGAKWAIYAAIAMTVIAIGLQLNGPSTFNMLGTQMTTSQGMLQVSSSLVDSSNAFLAEKGRKYSEEYSEFTDMMEEKWEELESVEDLLQNRDDVDPLLFIRPARHRMVPSESPTKFFARSLELPTYSTYGIHQEIPSFCDRKVLQNKNVTMDLYNQNIRG